MRFKLVLLTIGIASISAIYAQDSHGNRSDEKEVPVYSYIYEIKDDRDGDARTSTRSLDSPYAAVQLGTDDRAAVTSSDSTNDDKVDRKPSNDSANEDSVGIEFLDNPQPYIGKLDIPKSIGESLEDESVEDTSMELQRTARTSQNSNKSFLENITEESDESLILHSSETQYSGSFGARVRNGYSYNRIALRNRTKPTEEILDNEKKKKVFYSSGKIQSRENQHRLPHQQSRIISNENLINAKNFRSQIEEEIITERIEMETTESTIINSSIALNSKFSKPIVVQDIPRQNRYTYASTVDPEENLVPSTSKPVVSKSKSNIVEFNYHQLSPLQAGLALLNSGEINNTSYNTETSNEKVEENLQGLINNEEDNLSDQNETQVDQVLEEQEISDEVTQKVPAQPVEIEKSVEIFHTAPIQEIHYPVEYVPNIQKLARERRPIQPSFNIYKSNEILDEKLPQSNILRPNPESTRHDFEVDIKRPLMTKVNIIDELNQSASNQNQDQYIDIQKPETESPKPYNYDFQKLLSPASTQEKSPNLDTKIEAIENIDQLRKVQYLSQYPVEKVVEKTVHVPHPIAIEKLVEQKVPYPVEKVVEKQVMIPHPIPIHIQVPIDRVVEKQVRIPHIYPIHIEKVAEKKIPYALPRYVVQPYAFHLNGPHSGQVPRSYLIDVDKSTDRIRPYQEKFGKIQGHFPHVQYEKNHQFNRGQDKAHFQGYRVHEDSQTNSSQYSDQVYSNGYGPVHQIVLTRQLGQLPRKYTFGNYFYPYSTLTGPQSYRRRGTYVLGEKEKDHSGPVAHQAQVYIQPKSFQYSSMESQNGNGGNLISPRRARQENSQGNTGSFKQSKIEYGFKPPMVPSVQYDEKTASKVE